MITQALFKAGCSNWSPWCKRFNPISGTADVLAWKAVGTESAQYITGFNLEVTNQTSKTPVYYLSLKAENGAGLVSQSPSVSTPIMVMEEDKAGEFREPSLMNAWVRSFC